MSTHLAARRSRARARDGWAALGFLSPMVIGFGLFMVYPLIASIVVSLYDWPVFGERTFVGLDNYRSLLDASTFWTVLRNTLVFVLAYVPANIAISLGLAVWISPRIRGRGLYRALFFLPAVTPLVANAVVWQVIFSPGGFAASTWSSVTGGEAPNFLGSSTWAMAVVVMLSLWQGIGYNLLIFSAGLDALPEDVMEAATLDGAGTVRRFWSIVLPLLSPSLFFALVMTLISSFQVFAQPFVLTGGGPGDATETLVTYLYRTGFERFDMGMASAVAWVVFGLIMLVTALQFLGQRRWVHYGD
ncbi:carbohydrate ABC transporter permease [Streptomyces radicis]|nr:sugar ABC transporter permease [Streptomyces radicis]